MRKENKSIPNGIWKNPRLGRALALLILFSLTLALAACGKSSGKKEETTEEKSAEEASTAQSEGSSQPDDVVLEQMVDRAMENLTLEEKVGQLFILCTDSIDFDAETSLTKKGAEKIKKFNPGGVIFFSFNLEDREQTAEFIDSMQAASRIPMFMAVDEEGGRVSRLANTEGMGLSKIPPMAEIGKTGDPEKARQVGETLGKNLSSIGFNLDFAPVADITTNQSNEEIGDRSFGSDPDLVSSMVSAEVEGLNSQGVCATLKHFPGQGDCGEDTHKGYVNLETSIDRLRDVEFRPFEAGIDAGADFVMISHVAVSSITQNEVPASLSTLMVSDILKGELGFDGVAITDAMNMKVITKFYDPAQAAVMAIAAGNDMILMPDNFEEAYQGILDAIEEGDLEKEQINRAVERVLSVKIKRGIIPTDSPLLK